MKSIYGPNHKRMCDDCYEGIHREIGEFETCTVPSLVEITCEVCGKNETSHCGNPPADYVSKYMEIMSGTTS